MNAKSGAVVVVRNQNEMVNGRSPNLRSGVLGISTRFDRSETQGATDRILGGPHRRHGPARLRAGHWVGGLHRDSAL